MGWRSAYEFQPRPFRIIVTILREVVPRTIGSSTRMMRFPRTVAGLALCFSFTESVRSFCVGWMNVRPT